MPLKFLDDILAHKRKQNQEKAELFNALKAKCAGQSYSRFHSFRRAISQPGELKLIAEIKKASPSQGLIREDFDPLKIARIYFEHKAAAISVLTEEKYFLGKMEFIEQISAQWNVPILTKDFIIHEGQIFEARVAGASAVLLIAAILDDKNLRRLLDAAAEAKLDALLEVHNERELERVLSAGAEIIGINNRDLNTFEVDIETSERLIPQIPQDKIVIAESGIQTREDIRRLKGLGAHAVLIGETFMRAKDIGKKIEEVMYG